jgi:transposase InsO family protein
MVSYIDDFKGRFGVEPICRVLPIAPSTYYEMKARERDPSRLPPRAIKDEQLKPEIRRVWEENYRVYGARKVWKQLNREGIKVARCTVARLMREMGLRGVTRGKKVITTLPGDAEVIPLDRVNRDFTVSAPNRLWVADLSYVATWQCMVYVAFVIDAFARRIVGWRVSSSLKTDIALDALEQALYDRDIDAKDSDLVHHSDRGVQYVSIRYTERLSEAGIEPSVGSVGDSYDNALAETIISLYKTWLIRQRCPWKNIDEVEYATLEWVDWFNNWRLFQPIGDVPPAEYEMAYYRQLEESAMAA